VVSQYQNSSILDFVGAKDDGGSGDSWRAKMHKAPIKSSPPTNQHPAFYKADVLSVTQNLLTPGSPGALPILSF